MRDATTFSQAFAGRDVDASSSAQSVMGRRPNDAPAFRLQIPTRTIAGRLEQARGAMMRLPEVCPLPRFPKIEPWVLLRRSEGVAGWAEDLGKAGLRE